MPDLIDNPLQDVMQVCRNGHVITDLLHTYPDRGSSHCDRCGETTLDRCATCGMEIPGAVHVPGLVPVGRLQAPEFCASCGAPFPWSKKNELGEASDPMANLERLLRRLPLVIRQLRSRHGNRPAFQVADERDLEDLLRCLLPVYFDDIRPESRTPSYDSGTRTDFRLNAHGIALTIKRASSRNHEKQLGEQLQEDVSYYERESSCQVLVGFIHDPERFLHEPDTLEAMWSKPQERLELRCVIAG
ncbi:MAG TPA: DUF2321 domain-containing protein [Gemmataceae bacterium]|jgi:hypothetical protein|nr:DUF2321 domain-containing protein [Gemmataceae bacterium]